MVVRVRVVVTRWFVVKEMQCLGSVYCVRHTASAGGFWRCATTVIINTTVNPTKPGQVRKNKKRCDKSCSAVTDAIIRIE